MNVNRIVTPLVALMLALPHIACAWSGASLANHHGKLAVRAEKGVALPRPANKRCAQPVDTTALYKALKKGAAEPDSTDGFSSPFHSLNKGYDYKSWNPAIRAALGLPAGSFINGSISTCIRS